MIDSAHLISFGWAGFSKPTIEDNMNTVLEPTNRISHLIGKPKRKSGRKVLVRAEQRRSVNRVMAGVSAGFLPVASYVVAHVEAPQQPWLYALVAGALIYSAPTLAGWAEKWCGNRVKAWGFTVLLEGVMVFSHIPNLSLSALSILVAINAAYAHSKAKP